MDWTRWIAASLVATVLTCGIGWVGVTQRSLRIEVASVLGPRPASVDVAEMDSGPARLEAYMEPAGALLGAGESGGDPTAVRRADLDAELLITTVAARPALSSALIAVEDAPPRVYAIGDQVGRGTVQEIGRGRVFLVREDGVREVLVMGAGGEPTSSSVRIPGPSRIDWREGVTRVDDEHFEVTGGAISRALANLDELTKGARVTADFKDGALQGYRIFRIRRGSAAQVLGLRDNDVITKVDGAPIDPAALLGRMDELTTLSGLQLEIVRGGAPMVLEYTIH